MRQSVVAQLARMIADGETATVEYDSGACHESGAPVEGPWYIDCGCDSFCYYATRQAARDIIRAARGLVDEQKL